MTWPFGDLRPLSYGVILADPPWRFANYSRAGETKNPTAHYDCMDLAAIQALLVLKLVRALSKANVNKSLQDKALDYLKRNGLMPSAFREEMQNDQQ